MPRQIFLEYLKPGLPGDRPRLEESGALTARACNAPAANSKNGPGHGSPGNDQSLAFVALPRSEREYYARGSAAGMPDPIQWSGYSFLTHYQIEAHHEYALVLFTSAP